MVWLVLGVLLWSGVHLFKRLAPAARAQMGNTARGAVAAGALLSIVLMVIGYRGWDDSAILWNRAGWMVPANNLAMVFALYLYAASGMKTAITRVVRHPQLTAVVVWSLAHLLINGDLAAVVLFGGLGLWALLEIALINRAEPVWTRNPPAPVGKEVGAVVGAILVTGAIGYIHIWFGLSPFR